jgi:multifunctional 2-oxoglutarate metabolism enzyme
MKTPGDTAKIEERLESFGPNSAYVWELLQDYLRNPSSVDKAWQEFFLGLVDDNPPVLRRISPQQQNQQVPQENIPTVRQAAPQVPLNGKSITALRGAAARIVENMEASLSLPTATSFRVIPAKVLEENRRLINQYRRLSNRGKVSFTHIVAWAIVRALEAFSNLNASFARMEGQPYREGKSAINLGLAIDVTRKGGARSLVVPNVRDAGALDFSRFVEAYDATVRKAQGGTLEPADFEGTSITLTNPGTVGTVMSVPRLMPDQGAIVAMGAIGYEAEKDGMAPETLASLAISKVMHMTCTYDHRVIQGAESGQFLGHIHALLLGDQGFYDRLFTDLRIPFEPLRWSRDKIPVVTGGPEWAQVERQARVLQLINAYRVRGHLIANIDPLVHEPHGHPELDPAYYDLTIWDLDREFRSNNIEGLERATLREILDMLQETYCSSIGAEYMFMQDPVQKLWLQQRMESGRNNDPLSPERKKRILLKLIAAEAFERFLHTKFIGHKRFSVEGGETFLPILDLLRDDLADQGAERVVVGMAHRGRLNILANTIGKPLEKIFDEFEENLDPMTTQGTGDVKYHLGAQGRHRAPSGKEITVEVAPNPSHLESVNPVVEGMVRAMQERGGDKSRKKIIPILVHGDAAFAGQGIVPETLNLSQLDGYRTGGTIHVVIDNQIGFTTAPDDARSTPYSTDVAKMIQAPILHVNGDDPEAAVRVAQLALAYRQRFNRDVVIDMICYRKYGHNEGDEPSYTQPLLYQKIKEHPSVRQSYGERLIREGTVNQADVEGMEAEVKQRFDREFESSRQRHAKFVPDFPLAVSPEDVRARRAGTVPPVSLDLLRAIAQRLGTVPENFRVHPKLQKFFETRRNFDPERTVLDWAFAEALAFGSFLHEGMHVRLSGQDSARGTFSQRHAILYDASTGAEYVSLNHVRPGQPRFSVYDSLLSEAAVLGFEFGYSVADPLSLVLWEAQFGDFANNSQVFIDQYISSSEKRWQQPSDIVLLLPHGYEGQGPEHSSARLERFLQLSAEDNIAVCNVTTPAQYFHLLRRQKCGSKRRPLVVMTPKSLLRHPRAVSRPWELAEGTFAEILNDVQGPEPQTVERLVFCSGKVYYDIAEARTKSGSSRVAIVRIEQFYPWPGELIADVAKKYVNAREIVWLQEEPRNMGAWMFVQDRLHATLGEGQMLRYVGREAAASPATGSLRLHQRNQEQILAEAIGQTKA